MSIKLNKGRLLAGLLAVALCVGSLPPGLPAVSAAAAEDDSSSEFVGSFDLQEIFDYSHPEEDTAGVLGLLSDGNSWHAADVKSYWDHPQKPETRYYTGSGVSSKNLLSMNASWEIVAETEMKLHPSLTYLITTMNLIPEKPPVTATDQQINQYFVVGLDGNRDQKTVSSWNFHSVNGVDKFDSYTNDDGLTASEMQAKQNIMLAYDHDTKKLTWGLDNRHITVERKASIANTDKAWLSISGSIIWNKTSTLPTDSTVDLAFKSARYTHYAPQFVSTKLLGTDGSEMSDEQKKQLKDGDIVTVQAIVKNTHPDAGQEVVYDHLTIVPQSDDKYKKYPTAGLDILTAAEGQQIVVDGKPLTEDIDVAADGIPFGCTAAGNTITYRVKINNPQNKAVTVGQVMSDDFFGSRQYSGTELVPEQPLIPYDPAAPEEEQQEPGKDYHYIRTPANENGWNNGDVKIEFCPGDFDRFGITDRQNAGDKVLLDETNKVQQYTDELSGKPVYLQAESSKENAVSVKKEDEIKIDKTAPGLAAASTDLTLTDSLSGVWKLQKKTAQPVPQLLLRRGPAQAAEDAFQDLQVFELTAGNGAASQNYTISQNGVYRAVDAAGNLGAPQIISPIDPPSVLRPESVDDPSDPTGPSILPGPVVGPEVKPDDPVPGPQIDTDENGLKHAAVYDSINEEIDESAPLYGGNFDAADARALLQYRYQFSAHVAGDMTSELKIMQDGKDVTAAGADTTTAGSFTVVYKVTDADGNTTTLYLTDILTDPNAPPVVVYPDYIDPIVGPPIDPDKPLAEPTVKKDPKTGKNHAYYEDWATEVIRRDPALYDGSIDRQTALSIMQQRFRILSGQSSKKLQVIGLYIFDKDGKDITKQGIDTQKVGAYDIRYTVEDTAGNRVTITLHYALRQSQTAVDIAPQPDAGDTSPGSGPQADDTVPFTGSDSCPVHWLALLLTAAVWLYTLARRKKRTAFCWVDSAVLLLAALATGLLALMGSCPLDAPALILCGLSVFSSGLLVSHMQPAETDTY